MALFIVISVMSLEFFNTNKAADILSWFFRVFPHFSLAMGLNKITINSAIRGVCENLQSLMPPEAPPNAACLEVPACCSK